MSCFILFHHDVFFPTSLPPHFSSRMPSYPFFSPVPSFTPLHALLFDKYFVKLTPYLGEQKIFDCILHPFFSFPLPLHMCPSHVFPRILPRPSPFLCRLPIQRNPFGFLFLYVQMTCFMCLGNIRGTESEDSSSLLFPEVKQLCFVELKLHHHFKLS